MSTLLSSSNFQQVTGSPKDKVHVSFSMIATQERDS